jgi:hypothetical protein
MIRKILYAMFVKPNEVYDHMSDAPEAVITILALLVITILGIYVGFKVAVLYVAGIALYRIQFWMYKLGKMPGRDEGEEGEDP